MSKSREDSPDWLRSFQAPSRSVLTLSSGSESPAGDDDPMSDDEDQMKLSVLFKKDSQVRDDQGGKVSPVTGDSKVKSPSRTENAEQTPGRKRKRTDASEMEEEKDGVRVVKRIASDKPELREPNPSIWTLSSDSESAPETNLLRNDNEAQQEVKVAVTDEGGGSPRGKAPVLKSPKKQLKKADDKSVKNKESIVIEENDGQTEAREEDITEKQEGPQVSSSRLPLVLSEKVQRIKALVECEGDSIDLSGDVGSVGRIVVADTPSGNHDVLLDLKGTIYKTTIVPSRTFCVVSFGQSEAKIEAIMNDFIQLKSQSNVYEAETMVEGTLDGFTFDSDEEADNLPKPMDQNEKTEAAEDQPKGKTKGKAEKTKQAVGKKVKTGGKPTKKATKKTQATKKSKAKK